MLSLKDVHVVLGRIPLTSAGQAQAREAGQRIKDIIKDETLYVYVSPYLRATQTLDHVREALDPKQILVIREEPRVSEQQFGNFQNEVAVRNYKAERRRFGRYEVLDS